MESQNQALLKRILNSSARSGNSRRGMKPIANSHSVVVRRGAPAAQVVQRTVLSSVERKVPLMNGLNTALASDARQAGVSTIKVGREKEKKDMQELNERFANYIEQTRFLEAENKRLNNELKTMRDTWGKETENIKKMYETEMKQLRDLANEAEKKKDISDLKLQEIQEQLEDVQDSLDTAEADNAELQENLENAKDTLVQTQADNLTLKSKNDTLTKEKEKDRAEIAKLRGDLQQARNDLEQESLNYIDSENNVQALKDELDFLNEVHDAEMRELAALAYRDNSVQNRDFWKSEMSQAMREIQQEYDNKIDIIRTELDTQYSMQVQDLRAATTRDTTTTETLKEDNSRLRSDLQNIRSRLSDLEGQNAQLQKLLEAARANLTDSENTRITEKEKLGGKISNMEGELGTVLSEFQALLDAKLSLEMEISAYRKLLEGEETRTKSKQEEVEQTEKPKVEKKLEVNKAEHQTSASSSKKESKNSTPAKSPTTPEAKAKSTGASENIDTTTVSMVDDVENPGAFHESSVVETKAPVEEAASGDKEEAETTGEGEGLSSENNDELDNSAPKEPVKAKTSYTRSNKGPIAFSECSADGKFVILENTGKKVEELGGMKIVRNVENGKKVVNFVFPDDLRIEFEGDKKFVKIWAHGFKPKDSSDLEIAEASWGVGTLVESTLCSKEGEEKATHVLKIVPQ